ncbi:MAG: ABC transporter permease [Dehalococcoidia bacterium]
MTGSFLSTAGRAFTTVAFATVLVFVLLHTFADPATLSIRPSAGPDLIRQRRELFGLDDPYFVQLARYLWGAIRLDFGNSLATGLPASEMVLERLPRTLLLATSAALIAAFIGTSLGVLVAYYKDSAFDRLLTTLTFALAAIAEFWFGLMLLVLFAVELNLLPTGGYGPKELILPTATLALRPTGRIFQISRSGMVEALALPHIQTARSKGLAERDVVLRHALKNASVASVTLIGHEYVRLLVGATVIVEVIFSWPGVGTLVVEALRSHDLPVIEASVFVMAIMVATINAAVDALYTVLDPRIRYQ